MNEMPTTKNHDYDTLLNGLVSVGQMIERRLDEAVQPHKLSLAKLGVLHVLIYAKEPVALGALSQQLHCVRSNITQLVDRLEADKLVRRMPDAEDRRSVRAAITEEGRKRHEEGWSALEAAKQDILGGLSATDFEQLRRLLERLPEGHSP